MDGCQASHPECEEGVLEKKGVHAGLVDGERRHVVADLPRRAHVLWTRSRMLMSIIYAYDCIASVWQHSILGAKQA